MSVNPLQTLSQYKPYWLVDSYQKLCWPSHGRLESGDTRHTLITEVNLWQTVSVCFSDWFTGCVIAELKATMRTCVGVFVFRFQVWCRWNDIHLWCFWESIHWTTSGTTATTSFLSLEAASSQMSLSSIQTSSLTVGIRNTQHIFLGPTQVILHTEENFQS